MNSTAEHPKLWSLSNKVPVRSKDLGKDLEKSSRYIEISNEESSADPSPTKNEVLMERHCRERACHTCKVSLAHKVFLENS